MMATLLRRAALMALLWWLLTEGQPGWLLGALAVAAALWASLRVWPPHAGGLRLRALLGFIAFFVWNSAKGGAQVALLALRGRHALRPGEMELTLALPEGAPRILMVSALGLMPGTLCVELQQARLRLHVLDTRMAVADEAHALQAHIAQLFGVTTP